jgi:hypothetical protein
MNFSDIPADDRYEEGVITEVKLHDAWYSLYTSCGFGFGMETKWGVEPHVGDHIHVYGSLGRPIRGVVINDQVAYYRTPAEQDAENDRRVAKMNTEKRQNYETKRDEYEAKITGLPQVFQDRIARLRRNNPDFNWEFLGYELFCCEEAVRIAKHFSRREDVDTFHKLDCKDQKMVLPELDYENHSGNTFGMSCALAAIYIEHPELVDKYHGALCPLVGCKNYGCYSTECSQSEGAA